MSSHLNVYLLDTAATRALVGSGDDRLLEVIRERFGGRLSAADTQFDHLIRTGAPTAYEALKAVVHGGPFGEYAFQYRLAYERLCELTGYIGKADKFSHFRGDWLEQVDTGLRKLEVTAVSLFSFTMPQVPVPVAQTPELGYGEWSADQIAQALKQYEAASRTGAEQPLDSEVGEAVAECLDWLRFAASKPWLGIAGFFHLG